MRPVPRVPFLHSSFALVLLVAVVVATSGGHVAWAQASSKTPAITPESLLAATLRPADVQNQSAATERWWPGIPEFNVGLGDPRPDLRFYVVQGYQEVGEKAMRRMESVLNLFTDAAAAGKEFAAIAVKDPGDKGGTTVSGPALADEHRYFTRSTPDKLHETALRFRVGSVLGRLSMFSQKSNPSPETLARYAASVVQRTRDLLAGRLAAETLPPNIASLLPPSTVEAAVGPVLGSAVLPIEAWAVASSGKNGEKDRALLQRLGADRLGFRVYSVKGAKGYKIDVTVFPFADEKAAGSWINDFTAQIGRDKLRRLNQGDTGAHSEYAVFRMPDGTLANYELQFAKGRYACDVSGNAPFGETTSVIEAPVRKLAELWFAALPNR